MRPLLFERDATSFCKHGVLSRTALGPTDEYSFNWSFIEIANVYALWLLFLYCQCNLCIFLPWRISLIHVIGLITFECSTAPHPLASRGKLSEAFIPGSWALRLLEMKLINTSHYSWTCALFQFKSKGHSSRELLHSSWSSSKSRWINRLKYFVTTRYKRKCFRKEHESFYQIAISKWLWKFIFITHVAIMKGARHSFTECSVIQRKYFPFIQSTNLSHCSKSTGGV